MAEGAGVEPASRGFPGIPPGTARSTVTALRLAAPGVLAPRLLSRGLPFHVPQRIWHTGGVSMFALRLSRSRAGWPSLGSHPPLSSLCQSFVALAGVVIYRRRVRSYAFFFVPVGVVRHILVALVLNR